MLPKQMVASSLESQLSSSYTSLLAQSSCLTGAGDGNDLLMKQAKDLIVAAAASVLLGGNMANPGSANGQSLFSPISPLFGHQHCGCSVADSLVRTMPKSNSFTV